LGQPLADAMLVTNPINAMMKGLDRSRAVGELPAAIREYRVDLRGPGGHQVTSDLSRDHVAGCGMPLGSGPLAGTIDGDQQGELAFCRAYCGDIAVAGAERIARERFLLWLVTRDGWQAAEAVPLHTPDNTSSHPGPKHLAPVFPSPEKCVARPRALLLQCPGFGVAGPPLPESVVNDAKWALPRMALS